MAISGLQTIQVGLQNESTGSDSLYTAFTKTRDNFGILANTASPFNTFASGTGINANANTTTNTVTITNIGVTSIIAGNNITVDSSNGNVTISSTISNSTASGSNTQIQFNDAGILSGNTNFTFNKTTGVFSALYLAGNGNGLSNIQGANVSGQVGNSLIAGTVYTAAQPNITSVGTLTSLSVTGNITSGNANVSGNINANFFIGNGSQLTNLPAPTITEANTSPEVFVMVTDGNLKYTGHVTIQPVTGDIYTSGNISLVNIVSANTLTGNLSTAAQPNITSVGTLASLSVTGNISGGNLILTTGNIIYTPRYGSFYSNATQTNPVANTAMAMTFNNSYSANGVSVVSNSRLTVAKAGTYNIQFSAQFTKTDAGTDYMEVWLSKNGTSVPWTNTRLRLVGSNVYEVASWNFVETLGATEYVQLMWGSSDLNAQIVAIPSANTIMGIDVPSVIVTVTPVGA